MLCWLSVDPLAEKFPSHSPYNYCLNNPVNLIDPTGMSSEVPGDPPKGNVRIILSLGGGADLDDSANTRAEQIKKSNPNDKLIYITDDNLGNLKKNIESQVEKATKEGYGKTVEFSVFGHNGVDGPKGDYYEDNSLDLSKSTGSEFEKGQMSVENWGNINYNFDAKASVASFYGCNSLTFAEKFLNSTNVKHAVGILGGAGGSYSVKGDFDSTTRNFIFSASGVYMRSQENGKVLPMSLITRGNYKLINGYKSYFEREIYGNATVITKK